jgi:glycerophosphoryl diester phosphodiesterase
VPRVFAHRGGSALAPENTTAAFDNGLALGADGLEMDVHLSRDGVVVVHHDSMLDRTTALKGPIAARTADELAHAGAGGVPALAGVLARYPGVPIIVECKVNTIAMAKALVGVVRRAGATDRVCVGSFGRRVLRAVRTLEPAMATSAAREDVRFDLYQSWLYWPMGRRAYSGYQVPEFAGRTRVVSPRFIARAHRAGLGIQVWTVDTEEDARRLFAWGADALITDRPDIVVPVCRSRR